MNLNAYNNWLNGVIDHYGSLDNFPDARTIRIMRNGLIAQLAEYDRWMENAKKIDAERQLELLDFETNVSVLEDVFAADVIDAKNAIAELDAWLIKRGLE